MALKSLIPNRNFIRTYGLSFCAGMVASLSLPPLFLVPCFLAFGFVIKQAAAARNIRQAALHIGAGAYGYFLISLYWISHSLFIGKAEYLFLAPFSFFGVPVILTIFWMVGGSLGFALGKTQVGRAGFIIMGLGLAEWAREFVATGFPWNAPGLIFLVTDISAQSAAYLGQTGLNLLAFLLAGIVPFWFLIKRRSLVIIYAGMGLIIFVLGWMHLQKPLATDNQFTALLIQPHIAQAEKWQRDKRARHLASMIRLAQPKDGKAADLVILPESAFAGDYSAATGLVADVVQKISAPHQMAGGKGHVIIGALRFDETDLLRNSALYFAAKDKGTSQDAPVIDAPVIYDKTHLVPFGEYVPWRAIPFIDAIAGPLDFHPGAKVYPLEIDGLGKAQILICYEAIFPALTGASEARPDMLVNMTNDAWFGHTAGPYQHLAQTRMTAISYGVPLLRVANTGISAGFDAFGRSLGHIALGEADALYIDVPAPLRPTIFAQFSHFAFFMLIILMGITSLMLDRFRQKRQ